MKALVAVGLGSVVLLGLGAVAWAASERKKTHVDGPVQLPASAIAAAPELGLGHVSEQTDSKGVKWVVAVFPDTGNANTVVTIAALENPVGPWVRFQQNVQTGVRTLLQLDTAGQPVDPNALKASWGV